MPRELKMSFKLMVIASAFLMLVSTSLCGAEIFPYLSCYERYSQDQHERYTKHCNEKPKIENNETLELRDSDNEYFKALACYESCVLEAIGFITSYPSDKEYARSESNYRFIFKMRDEFGSTGLCLQQILYMIPYHPSPALDVIRKTAAQCQTTLDEVANIPKSTCDKWGPLYDCVVKSLGCKQ